MDEVLSTLKIQVQEKLLENLKIQEENRRTREEILSSIEKANKELEEYVRKNEESKESWKKDLEQQVSFVK